MREGKEIGTSIKFWEGIVGVEIWLALSISWFRFGNSK
jgi:hypothetical protein